MREPKVLRGGGRPCRGRAVFLASWIPSILIMILIFSFSARPAEESRQTSGRVTQFVVGVVELVMDEPIPEGSLLYDEIHHVVRKMGHFLEYMALGCTLVLPFGLWRQRHFETLLWCEATALLYACTDELHQLFVPGRDGNGKDVAIDATGALLGALVGIVVWFALEALRGSEGFGRKGVTREDV